MITKKRYQRNEGTGNAVWDLFAEMAAGRNESGEWDEDQYAEWALNGIGDQVSRNWDKILDAVAAEYPGAALSDNIETKVTNIHPSKKKVSLEDTRKVTIPVGFDPKYSEEDATEHVLDTLAEILDRVEYEQGQLPNKQGSLEWPEVMFDDVNFDGNNIIVPLKFSYMYRHSED